MCVILSAKVSGKTTLYTNTNTKLQKCTNTWYDQVPSNDDPTLADKEAILASLNIKAMTFDDTIGVLNHSKKIDDDLVNGHMKQIVAINDQSSDIT